MQKETDIAWAAGILEGEGSFLLKTGTTYLRVQVHMTDLDVLESLQKIFGGNIHPITKRKEHWKDAWVWALNGSTAFECMKAVRPYMHSRRTKKIDECIEARETFEISKLEESIRLRKLEERIALDYLSGGGTVRQLAKKYEIGRQSIFRYITKYREAQDNLS